MTFKGFVTLAKKHWAISVKHYYFCMNKYSCVLKCITVWNGPLQLSNAGDRLAWACYYTLWYPREHYISISVATDRRCCTASCHSKGNLAPENIKPSLHHSVSLLGQRKPQSERRMKASHVLWPQDKMHKHIGSAIQCQLESYRQPPDPYRPSAFPLPLVESFLYLGQN